MFIVTAILGIVCSYIYSYIVEVSIHLFYSDSVVIPHVLDYKSQQYSCQQLW